MSAVQYGTGGGATIVTTAPYPPAQPGVVVVQGNARQNVAGLCPYCGVGIPREQYSLLGIILAIVLFPCGIICCLTMKERRCGHCHSTI